MPEQPELSIQQPESLHAPEANKYEAMLQEVRTNEAPERASVVPPGFKEDLSPEQSGPSMDRWHAYDLRSLNPPYGRGGGFVATEGERMQDQAERAYEAAKGLLGDAIIEGKLPEQLWDRMDYLNKVKVVGNPNNMQFGYSGNVDAAGLYSGETFSIELSLALADDERATELAVHEALHALSGADFAVVNRTGIGGGFLEANRSGLQINPVEVTEIRHGSSVNHWLNEAMTDKLTKRVAGELSARVDAKNGKPRFYDQEIGALEELYRKAPFPLEQELEKLYFEDNNWLENLQQQVELFDRAFGNGFLARLNRFEDDKQAASYIKGLPDRS